MSRTILIINLILFSVTNALGGVSLIDQPHFIARHSQNLPQIDSQLKTLFWLENVMENSVETSLSSCQKSFKWDRWNCPRSDFYLRSKQTEFLLLDREDAYVKALTTASILYSITKNCSTGIIDSCNSCSDAPYSYHCSDSPDLAVKVFSRHFPLDFPDNLSGKTAQHNYKAVTNLLKKSLKRECGCALMDSNGDCSKEICYEVLKSFEDIAADIRQMYEKALQIDNITENVYIMWNNIPLDVLAYVKDSPNYCDIDAIPKWNGMRDRQCATYTHIKTLKGEELSRCRHLCHDCGYTVARKKIITKNRCNCKLTQEFQIQCEMCATVQQEYYCY